MNKPIEYYIQQQKTTCALHEALYESVLIADEDADKLIESIVMLPEHMRQGVIDYLHYGVKPGGFLGAVLSNDFYRAYITADTDNTLIMHRWAALLMYLPGGSWGSPSEFGLWMARGGLMGIALEVETGEDEHRNALRQDG